MFIDSKKMVNRKLLFVFLGLFLISFVSAWNVDINSPISGNNYDNVVKNITWSLNSINSSNLNNCWYELNNNSAVSFNCDDFYLTQNISSIENKNTWIIYANDTNGIIESDSVDFWVDSIAPNLTITNPLANPYYTNSNSININVLLKEANPSFDIFGRAVLLKLYFGSTFFNQWWMDFNSLTNISTFSYSPLIEGSYTYELISEDSIGHSSNISGFYILDLSPPIITLNGGNQTIEYNTTYNELGATANDSLEGDISDKILINNSSLNVSKIGNYTITYDVSDSAGNPAATKYRNVEVIDSTPPIITLNGEDPQEIEVFFNYTELNANATDNYDGDLTSNISIDSSSVNTSKLGSYNVTYSVNDSFGNPASVNRTVNVIDNSSPVIILNNDTSWILERAIDNYIEYGANATDNYDSSLTVQIDNSSLNVDVVGSYEVRYYVEDSSGNNASAIRIVNVTDTISPEINVTSPQNNITYITNNIALNVFANEPSTWNYSLDNGTTNNSFTPNTTLTLVNGNYELIIWAEDDSGNVNSTSVIFNVNVASHSTSSGGSCKKIWNCTLWSDWSSCENGSEIRVCLKKERVKCGEGVTISVIEEGEFRECTSYIIKPENTIIQEKNNNLTATINTEELNQGSSSPLTGNVIGNLVRSKPGFIILSLLGVVGISWLGIVLRKRFENY